MLTFRFVGRRNVECLLICEKMFCSADNGQTLCHGDTHIQNTYVINRDGNVKVDF